MNTKYGMFYATVFAAGLATTWLGGCTGKVESQPAAAKNGMTEPVIEKKMEVATSQVMPTDKRYTRALELFDEGSYLEAEAEFEKVCEVWPKFSKPFKHLARTQLKLEKFEEALDNAQHASELNPKDGTIDNVIGLAYMELDDFDSAEAAFKTAIAKTPTFSWSYNNLGYLKIIRTDYLGARDVLIEGSKVEKAPSILFNNLGIALEELGDKTGAKEAYAKAVEKDPASEKALMNFARFETKTPADTGSTQSAQQMTDVR